MKRIITIVLALALLASCSNTSLPPDSKADFTKVPSKAVSQSKAEGEAVNQTEKGDYNAMWISYLEWKYLDTTSVEGFTKSVGAMLDNCKSIGVNTLIVQVRPFSDAIYKSDMFPASHLLKGIQGEQADFDCFEVFIAEAKARDMSVEAWINPYRIRLNKKTPEQLASNNLANTHPEWIKTVGDGIYLDPSNADVQQYIIDGVLEVVNGYDIDGVQFDDYFYPTTDATFDKTEFEQKANGLSLEAWRRANVNTLIKNVYAAIKAAKPEVVFGISPQGNNDNNFNQQYSDVALWLREEGYADYIMPQLYWGFNYETKSGREDFKFERLTKEWASYQKNDKVSLYIGIGVWRIGAGDGGANNQDEWQTGHNIADMVQCLNKVSGVNGYALYRYDSLFNNSDYAQLCDSEVQALKSLVAGA